MDNPDLIERAATWASTHAPELGAAGMSGVVAFLRVSYYGGTKRQKCFDALLCACMTWCAVPGLAWLNLPGDLSIFVGCLIGYAGVEVVRSWIMRLADKRLPKESNDAAPR